MAEALIDSLRTLCGADAVANDAAARRLTGHDLFFEGLQDPQCVLRPPRIQALARAVAQITAAGLAVAPRGGGMSYTQGYLSAQPYVCIDLCGLNRVLEVNTNDLYITVQAGCTWAQVHAALAGSGYTTPYGGPLSGLRATVGGALSQNSVFFGAGQHGSAAETVLGLQVVLANGELLSTGSAAFTGHSPSSSWGGPDLTGLFVGDCGALGIKAVATLRLVPRPAAQGFASYGFNTVANMVQAQVALMRAGLGSECFGIDAYKAQHSAQTGNKLAAGVKTLTQVARSGTSLLSGLKAAAGVAMVRLAQPRAARHRGCGASAARARRPEPRHPGPGRPGHAGADGLGRLHQAGAGAAGRHAGGLGRQRAGGCHRGAAGAPGRLPRGGHCRWGREVRLGHRRGAL